MKVAFQHIAGSKNGLVERFDQDRVRLGRDPSNDLRFDPYLDRDASGFHGEIYEEEGKVWVHDLGSTNGTYVNGEKTVRKAIESGDLIEFGRHGPKVRFFAGEVPAGVAEGAAGAPAGEEHRAVGANTVHAIVNEAVKRAKGGGTAMFIKNAVREAVRESSRRSRLILIPLAFFLLVVAGGGAALFYVQFERMREQERQMQEKEAALQEALKTARSTEEILLAFQEQFRGQFLTDQQEEEDRRRQMDENLKRIERMEILLQGMKATPEKKEDIQQALLRAKNERAIFQEIERSNEPSLFLVFTSFKAKAKDGSEKTFQCFGTAFAVTREGHLFTNKHVVQPWKFAAHKTQLDREGLTVDAEGAVVAAWRAGSQVYVKKAGSWALNLEVGYNNRTLKNLELFSTAPDHMDWITISGAGDDESDPDALKVHAHVHDNNDLAVLKVQDKLGDFRPVRLATAEDAAKLQKLDPVLAMGFPRGGGLLERGVAEPTASRGDIRKIETSILISAPIIGGNSGGPVFSEDGAVIGVSTRTIKGAESFGFCVPIQNALALLPPEYR